MHLTVSILLLLSAPVHRKVSGKVRRLEVDWGSIGGRSGVANGTRRGDHLLLRLLGDQQRLGQLVDDDLLLHILRELA